MEPRSSQAASQVQFQAHAELLQCFLAHRREIVDKIEGGLNAQRKPADYLEDRAGLSRFIDACFFSLPSISGEQSRLRTELDDAHRARGFRPRQVPGLFNDLVDPAEMAIRGFHCWRQTRWPGRNGRVRYAQTLFKLFVLRRLALLSLRLWDAGSGSVGERLGVLQGVLDELWRSAPDDQSVLVRDARWLIPLAQSPTTDELGAYFDVAESIADSFTGADLIEVRKASVQMISGHLRSQIRHYCLADGVTLDDESVVLRTRTSNALDFALLIQGLVPLLEAYERAVHGGEDRNRHALAGVICQAVSPDPELFLNRVDLLGAYSMIEHLFVATDAAGRSDYTSTGQRHIRLLRDYTALIGRLSRPLREDCVRFRPVDGVYSPYGAIFGTPSNLTEDMALKTLDRHAATGFALEDVFVDGGADKLAWVNGWRDLPHVDPKVRLLYEYPQQFAEDMFARIERALRRSVGEDEATDAMRTGSVFIEGPGDGQADAPAIQLAAEAYEPTRFLRDRQEGYFVVSYESPDGQAAIRKDFLTEFLGAGRNVRIVGLPPAAAAVARLMCRGLVGAEGESDQASTPPSILKA